MPLSPLTLLFSYLSTSFYGLVQPDVGPWTNTLYLSELEEMKWSKNIKQKTWSNLPRLSVCKSTE